MTSSTAILADAIEFALAVGYLLASARLQRRRTWNPMFTAAFLFGVVAVWVAIGSGVAAHDDNETVHVVQHVLLMMVAPPLIVAGRPLTLLCQASPRRRQVLLVKVLHSRVLSSLTSPRLTWPLYVIGMFIYWLCLPAYQATLTHPVLHEATHAGFLAVGLLYWQPLLGDGSAGRLLSHPVRILGLLLTMPFELILGVGMTLLPRSLEPGAPPGANRAAGQMFWITAMLCSGLAVVATSIDWLARDERAARRSPAKSPANSPRSTPTPA